MAASCETAITRHIKHLQVSCNSVS